MRIDPKDIANLMGIAGDALELCRLVETPANPVLGIPASSAWQCRPVVGYITYSGYQAWRIAGPELSNPEIEDSGGLTAHLGSEGFTPNELTEKDFLKYNDNYYQLVLVDIVYQQQGSVRQPLTYTFNLNKRRDRPTFRRS